MNCFPCFTSKNNDNNNEEAPVVAQVKDSIPPSPPGAVNNTRNTTEEANIPENGNNGARTFTFRELAMATKNFRQETLLGEGGFGKLYRGTLQTGEVVAVKRLDRNGTQGNKEFLVEVLMLTLLHHPNLVSLLGYCADGEQRLLVAKVESLGEVYTTLFTDLSADKKPLDWQARMKIACGAAQGLEYLHEKANPSIVYRDMKTSNILLDEEYNPKLSDYGIAKLAQGNTKMHISPGVMGTYGHCAPEYERHGELTIKSDIYSFGVVLLEIITGRKSFDTTRPTEEQNLVTWAQPFFKDPKRFPQMADPLLKMEFPERSINQAIGIAAMCLQDEPSVRPMIGDAVAVLSFLAVAPPGETIAQMQSAPKPSTEPEVKTSGAQDHSDHSDSSDNEDGENSDEYTSNSDYDSSGSSIVSDHEDGGNAAHRDEDGKHLPHQESKKGKKSLSSKHTKKHKSKKIARKDSSSHKKKNSKDDKGSISFRSSSSGSSHHSSRRSANLRQTSIEESQDGSSGTSLERGRYEESFSWSIGSSSRYKSRSGSGHTDSESGKNIKLHNSSRKSSRNESSSMRSKNASTNSNSRYSRSEDESYSSSDGGDDEIEHKSKS